MERYKVINSRQSQLNREGHLVPDEGSDYVLPAASATQRGGVKAGANLTIAGDVLSADDMRYDDTELRGDVTEAEADIQELFDQVESKQATLVPTVNIKTINGTSILGPGDLVIDASDEYVLPAATATTLGGVKVGSRLSIAGGVLSAADQSFDPTPLQASIDATNARVTQLDSDLDAAVDTLSDEIDTKQATLVSGTNIKTLNGTPLLGAGDVAIPVYTLPTASAATLGGVRVGARLSIAGGVLSAADQSFNPAPLQAAISAVDGRVDSLSETVENLDVTLSNEIETKQDALVSGTNIKTVNGTSILGPGNISVTTPNPFASTAPVIPSTGINIEGVAIPNFSNALTSTTHKGIAGTGGSLVREYLFTRTATGGAANLNVGVSLGGGNVLLSGLVIKIGSGAPPVLATLTSTALGGLLANFMLVGIVGLPSAVGQTVAIRIAIPYFVVDV